MYLQRVVLGIALLVWCVAIRAVVITDSIKSDILGAVVKYNVYCPPSFDNSGDTKYPVLYLLHGLSDTYNAWNANAQLGDVADELIGNGAVREMIVIMPNAGGPDIHNIWNGYFNMQGWSYEDFFFKELIPHVEAKYHVVGDKNHRAISGLSMGGGGSVGYSQKHPEMFSSCYAMSAWLDRSENIKEDKQDKLYYTIKGVQENSALAFVEKLSNADVEKINSVKWFLDVGDDDFLLDQNERLHMLMRMRGINAELRVRDGGHNWKYWKSALYVSLPFASANFVSE